MDLDARKALFDTVMDSFGGRGSSDAMRARDDLAFFIERTFLDQRGEPIKLQWFHHELIKALMFESRVMALLPRSWGKSSICSVWYPAWRLGRNRDLRITIASNTLNQARWWLSEIENVMTKNRLYIETFGYLVPKPRTLRWTDTEKVVLGRSHFATHSSLLATGVGSALLGSRADIIIADDIVGENEAKSPAIAQAASDWFWRVLMPTLEPDGQVVVVGSRWSTRDLYAEIMERWGLLGETKPVSWKRGPRLKPFRYPGPEELEQLEELDQLDATTAVDMAHIDSIIDEIIK